MSDWKEGMLVSIVQDRAGGTTTIHARDVRITKVTKLFVTLENGEVFTASTGYARGAQRTRGIGRGHERRIEAKK